jgi:hypothetical protein
MTTKKEMGSIFHLSQIVGPRVLLSLQTTQRLMRIESGRCNGSICPW